jgi:putative glycerol-1-phosphate prenyltransferase
MNFKDLIIKKDRHLAILIDPDKQKDYAEFLDLIKKINLLKPSFIFVGGSTVNKDDFESCITNIKSNSSIPVVIFPGSHNQISKAADAILFLSLISGRNPDYLVGHQIEAAPFLKQMDIEVLPTAYLLIDGGTNSAVAYVSQTTPIPADQNSIAVNTAIAGEMLGKQLIFMDAGSGAKNAISEEMISAVKRNTNIPLIIGGGIKDIEGVNKVFNAGANVVVIGNKIEEDVNFLLDLIQLNKKHINA